MSLPVSPDASVAPHWLSDVTTLHESNARFREAFEYSPIGMALVDLDGTWLQVNPALCRILGYTSDDLHRRTVQELTHPDDRTIDLTAAEQLLAGVIPTYQLEKRYVHKDGSLVWALLTVSLVRDAAGQPQYFITQIQDISAQKRAEQALRECEARYRQIVETAAEGIWQLDSNNLTTFVNPRLAMMLGYTVDEMLGQTALVFIADEDHATVTSAMERRRQGISEHYDLRFRCKDGGVVWTHTSANPIVDDAGRFLGSFGMVTDISERKQAEEVARVSEERFRRAFELGLVGMAITSPTKGWLEVNDEICTILGYERSELLQLDWEQLTHPDDLAADSAQFERVLAGESDGYRLDKRFVRKDGEMVSATISVCAVRHVDGSVDYIVVLLHDMTERVRMEMALRQSERLYRMLAQQFPNGAVFLVDHDLRFTIADGQSLTAVGLSGTLIEGRTLHEVLPADVALIQEPLYRAALAGEQCVHELTTNGYSFLTYYLPVYDERGTIFGALAVSHDITERKQAEEALVNERALLAQRVEERTTDLRIANVELARTARMKDEFLATMSHELRTPLNAVLGNSEALRERIYGPLTDRQARALRAIEESGHHLLGLITDILDVAKIGAGKVELEIEPVSVAELCEASVQLVRQVAQKKQIHVQTMLDPHVRLVQADTRRLKQILVNLLANAVKFTPDGGAVGLDVAGDVAQQRLLFTVWDTGIGIAPEHLTNLFQPFIQLDARLARHYEGTGLGLVLVARLSDLHGGSVSVTSEEGVGSRFTVALPWVLSGSAGVADDVAVAQQQALVQSHTQLESLPGERATILLVDDNPSNNTAIGDYLAAGGYRVVTAHSGEEALACSRVVMPDLVLMDIQMRGMDGLETTRRMRAIPALAKVPVIALTALAMPGDRERCLAAGANDYLAKPVSLRVVQQTIAAQLQRQ